MTIVVFASMNSRRGGDETTPNPKLTVPSTTPATVTTSRDTASSSSPASSVPRNMVSRQDATSCAQYSGTG